MNYELLKIRRILENSKRVSKAREMAGLNEGEYLLHMPGGKAIKVRNSKNKVRTVTTIKGKDAGSVITDEVVPYIHKEIDGYFGLSISIKKHILMGIKKPPYGFFGSGVINVLCPSLFKSTKTEPSTIIITFNKKLNSSELKDLNLDIKRHMNLIFSGKSKHERHSPIYLFDEKYQLAIEYEALQADNKIIPKKKMAGLVEKAGKLLNKAAYTPDDFRKMISRFKSQTIGV